MYPALSVGVVLIIDDYGHWRGLREATDKYFAARGDSARPLRLLPAHRCAALGAGSLTPAWLTALFSLESRENLIDPFW